MEKFKMMKEKYLAGIIAGIAGMTLSLQAQAYNTQNNYNTPEHQQTAPPQEDHWHYWDNGHLYQECEMSLDLFGVGLLHSHDFNNGALARHDLKFGGSAGLNIFLTKCLGIGGDFGATTFKHSFVNTTTGNLIFPFPIGDTGLAPYIFGGAGYQFEGIDQIVGGGGLGVEFRFAPHCGIFVDGRYLAAVKTEDFGEGRAGVRLSF